MELTGTQRNKYIFFSDERNVVFTTDWLFENFGAENFNFGIIVFPCIPGKSCFVTGLLKKSVTVPTVFGSNLREKKSPVPASRNYNTISSDNNFFDVMYFTDWSKNTYFKFYIAEFRRRNLLEPRILERGSLCHFRNRGDKGSSAYDIPYTPSAVHLSWSA